MAAQIVANFLKKRPSNKRRAQSFALPDAEAQSQRNATERESPAVTSFSFANVQDDERTNAAKLIQSAWRGYTIRRELKHITFGMKLTGHSIQTSLDFVLDWHEGWKKLGTILFLLLFFLITVYYQNFSSQPAASSVDLSFAEKMETDALQEARELITDNTKAYALMHAWIDNFLPELESSQECKNVLHDLVCPRNATRQSEFGNNTTALLEYILETCEKISTSSGFVDASNRLIGTMYVYQTRRKAVPCTEKMKTIDPFLGITRECLGDELDDQFNNMEGRTEICNSCDAFVIHPKFKYYLHALTGDAFNLPSEFMHCRVEELERAQWLDYRTKDLCFMASLLDINRDGRLVAYTECFAFSQGGEVKNIRETVSLSFLAGGSTSVLALTICSIIITSLHQFGVCVRATRRKLKLLSFWLRLAAPVCELTANSLFLAYLYRMSQFHFSEQVTNVNFYIETFAFLDDAVETFALADLWLTYTVLASLALLFRLVDVLRHLDFHPSSAIVGGVLTRSATNLLSFFFVFFIFVLVYAFIGILLFSRTTNMFSTYGEAINSLLLVAIGEVERFVEETIANQNSPQSLIRIQNLYFWFFVFMVSILLFNVLLAIIVGAYVEMTDASKHGGAMFSFPRSFRESVRLFVCDTTIKIQRFMCNGKKDTFVERLLVLRSKYRVNGCMAPELRAELTPLLLSAQSVEHIISRCRAHTKHERFKTKALYMQGVDTDSEVLQRHKMAVLETIEKKMDALIASNRTLSRQQSLRGGSMAAAI